MAEDQLLRLLVIETVLLAHVRPHAQTLADKFHQGPLRRRAVVEQHLAGQKAPQLIGDAQHHILALQPS